MTRRLLTAGHIFVIKYVLISALTSFIFKSGRKPKQKKVRSKLMDNIIPVFNLIVFRTDDGYVVVYNDKSFYAVDEQSALSLIRNFAEARFEW